MGIIIGQATTVSFGSACVVSVNWNTAPNLQNLFCLNGTFVPWKVVMKPTQSVSLTCYSPGPVVDVTPSTSCSSPTNTAFELSATGASCNSVAISGDFIINNYSYSKEDFVMPGQESWGLIQWVTLTPQDDILMAVPNFIIRGISEGYWSIPNISGIVADTVYADYTTGNVSAAQVGRTYEFNSGTVTRVGGGSNDVGQIGQGNVSIPLTPVYFN